MSLEITIQHIKCITIGLYGVFFYGNRAVAQENKAIDYKHIFCEEKHAKEGVIWKHCDYHVERFIQPDTIRLFRQLKRWDLTGVERCGSSSRCWRFFDDSQFKESYSWETDDSEAESAIYKISFNRKLKRYLLTVTFEDKHTHKKFVRYAYYIYQTFQDTANVITKIVLVKSTPGLP
ncbi:MAG: hypothetical protein V4580_06590 [Bacteroidota bacterium]